MRCSRRRKNPVDELTAKVMEAMEQAAISGLCREGQIEIGAQAARELRPERASAGLLELVTEIYDDMNSGD
jgi:hypothetical protein